MSEETITRDEHLAWCKQRALEYVNRGDLRQALASMASDLSKHPGTRGHASINLGYELSILGHLNTAARMREFIERFR